MRLNFIAIVFSTASCVSAPVLGPVASEGVCMTVDPRGRNESVSATIKATRDAFKSIEARVSVDRKVEYTQAIDGFDAAWLDIFQQRERACNLVNDCYKNNKEIEIDKAQACKASLDRAAEVDRRIEQFRLDLTRVESEVSRAKTQVIDAPSSTPSLPPIKELGLTPDTQSAIGSSSEAGSPPAIADVAPAGAETPIQDDAAGMEPGRTVAVNPTAGITLRMRSCPNNSKRSRCIYILDKGTGKEEFADEVRNADPIQNLSIDEANGIATYVWRIASGVQIFRLYRFGASGVTWQDVEIACSRWRNIVSIGVFNPSRRELPITISCSGESVVIFGETFRQRRAGEMSLEKSQRFPQSN
jgi:hypothetical protein